MSKLIVIEGTDCSGKETQTKRLLKRVELEKMGFPRYGTATGDIVGISYLGKKYLQEELFPDGIDKLDPKVQEYIRRSEGIFPEGAANVDPLVALCYFGADRRYALPEINKILNSGSDLILDRYVASNMAHQGAKEKNYEDRQKLYKKLDYFEYEFLELPRPDLTIFLYMPYQYAAELQKSRKEAPDQHEASEEHLVNAENAYLELADLYNFSKIDCVKSGKIRSREDIHEEVYSLVKKR